MSTIRQEDNALLVPGMRVRIGKRLLGNRLYGIDDPNEFKYLCGTEATVRKVEQGLYWMVWIEEDENACFLMEEIDCIVDDAELPESEEPINVLLGCAI